MLRDILWLRITFIFGCIAMITYGVMVNSLSIIFWNSAFLIINAVQIIILFAQRRPIVLPDELESIYSLVFHPLTRREFLRLWKMGDRMITIDNAFLCHKNQIPEHLMFMEQGSANVMDDNQKVASLDPMQFVGEMSFLNQSSANADVITNGEACVQRWSHNQIEKLKQKHPTIYEKLLLILGQDLTRKITKK